MVKEVVVTEKIAPSLGPYCSTAVKVKLATGTLLFLSGQVPEDSHGNLVGKGDIEAQTRQVMERIKTIVEAGGGTMDDIVQYRIFLTDIKTYKTVSRVRSEYLKKEYPAGTLCEVKSLADEDWLIEIDAIAFVSS